MYVKKQRYKQITDNQRHHSLEENKQPLKSNMAAVLTTISSTRGFVKSLMYFPLPYFLQYFLLHYRNTDRTRNPLSCSDEGLTIET